MQLHDIFPALAVVEYSLYWVVLYLMLCIIVLSLLWRYLKHHKRRSIPYYLNLLEHFDTTNAKQIAHQFAYYGKQLVKTASQTQKFHSLVEKLNPYKYLPNNTALPKDLTKELRDFLQTIRRENV